jgi:hypothetical protein
LWCGSKHRPKHFNERTYTVVADCDSDLRDRFALCQHLKGRMCCASLLKSRLYSPPPAGENASLLSAGRALQSDWIASPCSTWAQVIREEVDGPRESRLNLRLLPTQHA